MFRMVEKRREIEVDGEVVAVVYTNLPIVKLTHNRRVAAEHQRLRNRFERMCDKRLVPLARLEHKLCKQSGRHLRPLRAELAGTVTLSDDRLYCVSFTLRVTLPDGTAIERRFTDLRAADDGFPLVFEHLAALFPSAEPSKKLRKTVKRFRRDMRCEARKQLDIRARFDSQLNPRALSRVKPHMLAVTEAGLEFLPKCGEGIRFAPSLDNQASG